MVTLSNLPDTDPAHFLNIAAHGTTLMSHALPMSNRAPAVATLTRMNAHA
jgi:hypothetical protein